MGYIVRLKADKSRVFTGPQCSDGFCCSSCGAFEKALVFDTLDDAKRARSARIDGKNWDVLEVTYGLRWQLAGDTTRTEIYASSTAAGCSLVPGRKQAHRFATAAEARAIFTSHPCLKPGFHGAHDTAGYHVVRFMKVVA